MTELAAALQNDLALLEATSKEVASLLGLAAWRLGELSRQAAPMTAKTLALAHAKDNIAAARQRSEQVLEHLDASRKVCLFWSGALGGGCMMVQCLGRCVCLLSPWHDPHPLHTSGARRD
jgi:hypothetical protein